MTSDITREEGGELNALRVRMAKARQACDDYNIRKVLYDAEDAICALSPPTGEGKDQERREHVAEVLYPFFAPAAARVWTWAEARTKDWPNGGIYEAADAILALSPAPQPEQGLAAGGLVRSDASRPSPSLADEPANRLREVLERAEHRANGGHNPGGLPAILSDIREALGIVGDMMEVPVFLRAELEDATEAALAAEAETAALRGALEEIAEGVDVGRHDGLPEDGPAHSAEVMFAIARRALTKARGEAA